MGSLTSRLGIMSLVLVIAVWSFSTGGALAVPPLRSPGATCRAIVDNTARLACYDRAFGGDATTVAPSQSPITSGSPTTTAGDTVVLTQAQSDEIRRQSFGFNIPALSAIFKGSRMSPAEETKRLFVKVTEVGQTRLGALTFTLEGGATWRQVDDVTLNVPPKVGDTVEIRKAALGSYFLIFRGQAAMRVHRDQ